MRGRVIVVAAVCGAVVGLGPKTANAGDELPLAVGEVRTLPVHADLAGGTVQQRSLTLHGLVVRGAFETRVVGSDGVSRLVASRTPEHAPQLLPKDAVIEREQLLDIVGGHVGHHVPEDDVEGDPRLVYLDVLGHPVLAWEVQLTLLHDPEPTRPTLWVSAASGLVLDEVDQVLSSRALVYPENPAVTPDPQLMELDGVRALGAGAPLSGKRLVAYNCVTTWPEDPESDPANLDWWDFEKGRCYPRQLMFSNADGDYIADLPDLVIPMDHVQAEDRYAELSMYFHAERFLTVLEDRGVDGVECERPTMLANFHYLEPAFSYPELDFGPLNNAYYTGKCDPKGPTMEFGQGSSIDYAYDGDVVYHEMGHGVVGLLAPESLLQYRLRPEGTVKDARGLNEAFADYFSAMITEDPNLADYVGRYWPAYTKPYIRTAQNDKRCPQDSKGQEHNDGEPMMAALWAARTRVGEVVDKIVIRSLTRLPTDADLEGAAWTMLDIADELRAEGELDEFGYDVLFRSLDTRGLLDCRRVIEDPIESATRRSMYLRQKKDAIEPWYPGPMQVRHEIPNGSDNLVVTFRESPRGSSTGNPNLLPVDVRMLVKETDAPIEFTYDLVAIDEHGDASADESEIKEVTLVTGDWDLELDPTHLNDKERLVVVRGFQPGQVVYVTLVNRGSTEAVASDVFLTSVPSDELDEGSPLPEDGAGTGTGTGSDEGPPAGDGYVGVPTASGCGCRAHSPAPAFGLFVFGGLAWHRRRRCVA